MCTVDDLGGRSGDNREKPAAQVEGRGAAAPLHALLDHLLAMQRDLAGDVMPRAARITGTSQLLLQVRSRLDAAIGTARGLLADDVRARVAESSTAAPSPASRPWSIEQKCLAAVRAARSVT